MLRLSDFREGWTELAISDGQTQASASAVSKCVGSPQAASPTASALSAFKLSDFTTVVDTADQFANADDARGAYQAFTSDRAAECTRQLAEQGLRASGVNVVSSSVEPLPSPMLGDESSAFRVVAAVSVGRGQQIPLYFDSIAFRKGRTVLGLFLGNGGAPFVETVAHDLETKMTGRA